MYKQATSRRVVCLIFGFWLIFPNTSVCADDWKTFTHPEQRFSLRYPSSLKMVPVNKNEETMPSQEAEWDVPNGEEGARSTVHLGFYDMPEGETLMEWLSAQGSTEKIRLGVDQNTEAFIRTALGREAYEREVYVPYKKRDKIIALHLVIQLAKGGTTGDMSAIEGEHAEDIETFMKMARSLCFESPDCIQAPLDD